MKPRSIRAVQVFLACACPGSAPLACSTALTADQTASTDLGSLDAGTATEGGASATPSPDAAEAQGTAVDAGGGGAEAAPMQASPGPSDGAADATTTPPAGNDANAPLADGSGEASAEPDYSGKWEGLNSLSKRVAFGVFANAVTGDTFDWRVQAPGPDALVCIATGETSSTFGTPVSIAGTMFMKGPISGNPLVYTVTGTFDSATQAHGDLSVTHTPADCSTTVDLTWTAQHVVCGDGRIEWPETCDTASAPALPGCSSLCQLPVVAEQEPNDTVSMANGPFSNDAIASGSISTATDADVFAIHNPYAGTVAVTLETHGETVGTCGVDTFLQVVDASGNVLSQDDDSSRAWFCSLLQYSLSSGQTVYVVVTSTTGALIPTYNLHVAFQHS